MEPVIPADVHYQHISPRPVWFVGGGGYLLRADTGLVCVSSQALYSGLPAGVPSAAGREGQQSALAAWLPQLSRGICVRK